MNDNARTFNAFGQLLGELDALLRVLEALVVIGVLLQQPRVLEDLVLLLAHRALSDGVSTDSKTRENEIQA